MRDKTFVLAAWITGGVLLAPLVISSPVSISDREFGLSKVSVFEVPTPPGVDLNDTDPGEVPVIPPGFEQAPPVIPHGIVDFVPITLDENMCLECHLVEEKVAGEPTPVPESHFRDLRRAPDAVRTEIAGARYVCTTCHVSPTSAANLVENRF